MRPFVSGIHHITALAGDPQANIDFYTRTLGLRLVKRTVNFDDPDTYHFYFADEAGNPGTILTFFPWGDGALRGRNGTGQVSVTGFSIPSGSLNYWIDRLVSLDVHIEWPATRFGENVISVQDPDGVVLELVETDTDARPGWSNGEIPAAHAVRGFHQATLSLGGFERTAELLTGVLGYHRVDEEGSRFRFACGDGGPGTILDLLCEPGRGHGSMGRGAVHHIAFRAATDDIQSALRTQLMKKGYDVTPVLDRQYFRSIYFREPGGVLFEVATDPPGFLIDETAAELGTHLKLPPWFEPRRAKIEARLAPITLPTSNNPEIKMNDPARHSNASRGPHDGQPVLFAGVPLEAARAAAILVHGRGADAHDILGLASEIDPGEVAFAAPDAADHTWYPNSFLAPIDQNEPGISSGIRVLHGLVARFAAAGIPRERVMLIGFSQGACLALEYAVRHAGRFGGVAGLSGGLIGPPGTPRDYAGGFDGTPVFLGCSDNDPHIPRERVEESADICRRMGAMVTMRLYPRLGHGINEDEVSFVHAMLNDLRGE